MAFFKPKTNTELAEILHSNRNKIYLLAGGTDINVQRKNGIITHEDIIFINHLTELKGIEESKEYIKIGSLTTFRELIESPLLRKKLPYFRNSLIYFASPLLQTMATIGGNIANGSPTADVVPLLLVLKAKLELRSTNGTRLIDLDTFYTGYKKFIMRPDEYIHAIHIPFDGQLNFTETFYQKVGARSSLTIAKVSLAGLKKVRNGLIEEVRLAVGSLNEFPRRLSKMEEYLQGKTIAQINDLKLDFFLRNEITPISDLRSEKEYRFQVCYNLLKDFILQGEKISYK